jgi:hypothetical protein
VTAATLLDAGGRELRVTSSDRVIFPATERTRALTKLETFTDVRHAAIDDVAHALEPLLELYERDGRGDMPYPPDYPKMPGEPKRVQPSRDRDRRR